MVDSFIDKLVDWRDFERFVRDMYAEDPGLVVEHNVTEKGKSGARRQTDVRFTHKVQGHTFVTLVECKRWKSKVGRDRIDVLAASIEDLNASKGVIFTTRGFEEGAETYAKSKGIDLFLVRDLTDEEWGLPGRVVWLYFHIYAAEARNIEPAIQLVATVPDPPTSVSLDMRFRPDGSLDESLILRSVEDASAGPNLLSVIAEARDRALQALAPSVGLFSDGEDGASKAFLIPVAIDLANAPHRQLNLPYGLLLIERLTLELVVTISQTRFEADRGNGLDIALAIENYVTRERSVVYRRSDGPEMARSELVSHAPSEGDRGEVIENGELMQIFTEPWVEVGPIECEPSRTAGLTFTLPGWETRARDGSDSQEPG
jgi:hypothetical protein